MAACRGQQGWAAASTSLEEGKKEKDQGSSLKSVSVGSLRDEILHDVADGLLEQHDDGHLDEEVGDAAAGVALEGTTRQGLCPASRVGGPKGPFGRCYGRKLSFPEAPWAVGKGRGGVVCGVREWVPHLLQPPAASNAHIVPWVAIDPEQGSNSDIHGIMALLSPKWGPCAWWGG